MKRKVFALALESLNDVSELKGVKFAYAVLKNRKKIESQLEEDRPIFEKILEPTLGFKEYEEKRIELCKNHSEKDEDGEAITEGDRFKIIDVKTFNSELESLGKEYEESLSERKKQIEDYNNLMEENIDMDFKKVKFDDLPSDMNEKQLNSIQFMIDLD